VGIFPQPPNRCLLQSFGKGRGGEKRTVFARAQASDPARADVAVFGPLVTTLLATCSETSFRTVERATPRLRARADTDAPARTPYPYDVALVPVPEPSAGALLAAGIVSFAVRQRTVRYLGKQ